MSRFALARLFSDTQPRNILYTQTHISRGRYHTPNTTRVVLCWDHTRTHTITRSNDRNQLLLFGWFSLWFVFIRLLLTLGMEQRERVSCMSYIFLKSVHSVHSFKYTNIHVIVPQHCSSFIMFLIHRKNNKHDTQLLLILE